MAVDFRRTNQSCLAAFGQALTLTRTSTGLSQSITGILESGIEPEGALPGDGSVYAGLWLRSSDVDPLPENGDEVASATTVYKVLRRELDAGGGLRLLLRKDRDVT
jgi:hypothetical protein